MNKLIFTLLILATSHCLAFDEISDQDKHVYAIELLFIKTFDDHPRSPKDTYELDVDEQCWALKRHFSKAFPVVIPPCVALGLQAYE